MTEPLVLALDGSTRACGAALLRPADATGARWESVAETVEAEGRGQARILLRLVDQLLRQSGSEPGTLRAIVVGTGPGTFTGVRITVATARALGLALSIPVLGISTLAALAAGAAAVADELTLRLLVPVVDARRNQVFYGLYEAVDGNGVEGGAPRWLRSVQFAVCDRDALDAVLTRPALVVADDPALIGDLPPDASFLAAEMRPRHLLAGQTVLREPGDGPDGDRVGPWLLHALQANAGGTGPASRETAVPGQAGSPEGVKPIYVRSPDADIHITKMRDPWAPAATEAGLLPSCEDPG